MPEAKFQNRQSDFGWFNGSDPRVRVSVPYGIGWIDAHLIASALVGRFQLWTTDKRLSAVARELGVGYL
jgi:predicted nucleic acid-binding protein